MAVLAQTKSSHLDSRSRNAEQSLGGIIFYENKLVSLKLNVKDSKLTLQNTAALSEKQALQQFQIQLLLTKVYLILIIIKHIRF